MLLKPNVLKTHGWLNLMACKGRVWSHWSTAQATTSICHRKLSQLETAVLVSAWLLHLLLLPIWVQPQEVGGTGWRHRLATLRLQSAILSRVEAPIDEFVEVLLEARHDFLPTCRKMSPQPTKQKLMGPASDRVGQGRGPAVGHRPG